MAAARMVLAERSKPPARPGRKTGPASAVALAVAGCVYCGGAGYLPRYYNSPYGNVCGCVWRSIFRICWERYRECRERSGWAAARVHWQRTAAGYLVCGFKAVEYMADFDLMARRKLRGIELRVFEAHYLAGMDYRDATPRLKICRGAFFHSVYRIERTLGRAFATATPYSLFPGSYFAGTYLDNPLAMFQQASMGRLELGEAA